MPRCPHDGRFALRSSDVARMRRGSAVEAIAEQLAQARTPAPTLSSPTALVSWDVCLDAGPIRSAVASSFSMARSSQEQ
jgi:hypothetical protein